MGMACDVSLRHSLDWELSAWEIFVALGSVFYLQKNPILITFFSPVPEFGNEFWSI
jgi:hypothetical protein